MYKAATGGLIRCGVPCDVWESSNGETSTQRKTFRKFWSPANENGKYRKRHNHVEKITDVMWEWRITFYDHMAQ